MPFVKDTDILDATNGGLDIILQYYPEADKVISKTARTFKIRESEKTASAALKQLQNGVWVVTDFGGDQVSRNGIQVCMEEEGVSYGKACEILGARYGIEGAELQPVKPKINIRPLKKNETPGTYSFEFKDMTKEELALLGPRVNEQHCRDYKLKSCKSFTYCKENEAIVTEATEEYPIMVFDFGEWQKIYQPNSFEKQYRFRYAGQKPTRHAWGMDVIEKAYKKHKKEVEDDYQEGQAERPDARLEEVFIVSGGSDGLNLRSFEHFPVWFNSESEQLEHEEYKKLKMWAKNIYYIPDLDTTGVKQALQLGLRFLDIKILWLPERLKEMRDKRGNPRKDFKDFVETHYRSEKGFVFINLLNKLINNALPLQFWTEFVNEKKRTQYNLSNTRLYHFLQMQGFGRYEDETTKEGFIYVRKDGNIIRVLKPNQIENFVHEFLEQRGMQPELRDYMYKNTQLGEKSMSKLPKVTVDFNDCERDKQYFFFNKKVWEITPEEIKEFKQGEVSRFVWEDKIIDFNARKEEAHFNIFKDAAGNWDIDVLCKDNMFFNYLINTSRVHWRKELEEQFEGRPEKEAIQYHKENRFRIDGEGLSEDEIYEQKLHLINKIFSIGYMLHSYKNYNKPWAVFAMDNKVSDLGESHGGSGKSLCYSFLNQIKKRRVYLKGRDKKLTQNDFIYHEVSEDTDYILIDDATQYLDFDFFFSEITGSLKVNPKNGSPFEIPFEKSPKFVFTSNFAMRNMDPSTARRLLITVFSDYYHSSMDDEEYREVRKVSDDFGGRNLFTDFNEKEFNQYYNFCAQCVQFFLSTNEKIDPPMDNVTKRNLQAQMGEAFIGWAEAFFERKNDQDVYMYRDDFFSKEMAFEDFLKTTKTSKWSTNKFKKAMVAFSKTNDWILNPKDLHNGKDRIIQKIDGKTQEVFYMQTSDAAVKADIQESADGLLDHLGGEYE